eukprot:944262-Prorocentrum_minimum.AAC.1
MCNAADEAVKEALSQLRTDSLSTWSQPAESVRGPFEDFEEAYNSVSERGSERVQISAASFNSVSESDFSAVQTLMKYRRRSGDDDRADGGGGKQR